jgi:hypothetical protein
MPATLEELRNKEESLRALLQQANRLSSKRAGSADIEVRRARDLKRENDALIPKVHRQTLFRLSPRSQTDRLAEPLVRRPTVRGPARADQLFKRRRAVRRSTGILPVFFSHGQDARATRTGKLTFPGRPAD